MENNKSSILRKKYNALNDAEKKEFEKQLKQKIGIKRNTFLSKECVKPIGKVETERLLTYMEILFITNREIKEALPKIAILLPKERKKHSLQNTK